MRRSTVQILPTQLVFPEINYEIIQNRSTMTKMIETFLRGGELVFNNETV
jgi:hypothetical protein